MVRHFRALGVVLLLLAASTESAPGQGTGARAHELSLGIGLLSTAERDGSASPLLYDGVGPSYAVGYARARGRGRSEVRLDANGYGIASTRKTTLAARADLLRLGFEASYLRLLGDSSSRRWRLFAGAALLSSMTDRTEHLQNGESRLYRSYVVSGAPALRAELDHSSDAVLSYQLALPLLSGVTHPPSDIYLLYDSAMRRLRWRGPASYRQLEQRLTYTRAVSSRTGLRATLMNGLFADADDPQRAGARTAAMLTVVIWSRPRAAQ